MKKGMKRLIIILSVVIIVVTGGYTAIRAQAGKMQSTITYESVDMSKVADGTFYGETDAGLVVVKVGVTVKDHVIQSVEILEHKNGLGSKAEAITGTMLAQNTYQVDAVSGATLSSSAIKSAVSKALAEGSR